MNFYRSFSERDDRCDSRLHSLEARGAISLARKQIVITDRAGLKAAADGTCREPESIALGELLFSDSHSGPSFDKLKSCRFKRLPMDDSVLGNGRCLPVSTLATVRRSICARSAKSCLVQPNSLRAALLALLSLSRTRIGFKASHACHARHFKGLLHALPSAYGGKALFICRVHFEVLHRADIATVTHAFGKGNVARNLTPRCTSAGIGTSMQCCVAKNASRSSLVENVRHYRSPLD